MNINVNDSASGISLQLIAKSVSGETDAITKVIDAYEPYINEMSTIDGVFNNDLAQSLRMALRKDIPSFKMDK